MTKLTLLRQCSTDI